MPISTILAVDDSSDDLMLLELACGAAKVRFVLQTVRTGEAAIAYLEGTKGYADRERFPLPDLLLLDLKMPCVSGFSVLSWARTREMFRQLPIVVFTSSVQLEDRIRAMELGANAFVAKPVGFEALQRFVRALDGQVSPTLPTPDFRSLEVAVQGTSFASSAGSWPVLPGHGSIRR